MYNERRNTSGRGIVIIVILVFVGIAVKWLSDQYGAVMTGYVLLGLGFAAMIGLGWVLALATMKTTLNSQSDFNHSSAEVERYRQMTTRAIARGDTHWHKANAQISVLNAKRVDQLAQQRAGMLVDHQRQAQQPIEQDFWDDEADVRARWGE